MITSLRACHLFFFILHNLFCNRHVEYCASAWTRDAWKLLWVSDSISWTYSMSAGHENPLLRLIREGCIHLDCDRNFAAASIPGSNLSKIFFALARPPMSSHAEIGGGDKPA